MRPDMAIFSKEGPAIIVEFKAPGVSMDDHIGDLSEYALAGGQIKRTLKEVLWISDRRHDQSSENDGLDQVRRGQRILSI